MEEKSITGIESLEKRITEITTATEKAVRENETALEKARATASECEKQLEKLVGSGTPKEYAEARRRLIDAQSEQEFHERLLKKLRETPAITQEEYQEGEAAVFAELEAATEKAWAEILEHFERVLCIADTASCLTVYGNRTLAFWRRDCFLDKKVVIFAESANTSPQGVRLFNDFGLAELARNIRSSNFYKRAQAAKGRGATL